MDYAGHYQRVLEQYARLGPLDGWKQYVWAQVKQLAHDCPELYRDLPQLLTEKIKEAANDRGGR